MINGQLERLLQIINQDCLPIECSKTVAVAVVERQLRSKHWIWQQLLMLFNAIMTKNENISIYFVTSPPFHVPDKAMFMRYNLNLKHAIGRLRRRTKGSVVYLVPLHTWLVNGGRAWPEPSSLIMVERAVLVNYIVLKIDKHKQFGGYISWKI